MVTRPRSCGCWAYPCPLLGSRRHCRNACCEAQSGRSHLVISWVRLGFLDRRRWLPAVFRIQGVTDHAGQHQGDPEDRVHRPSGAVYGWHATEIRRAHLQRTRADQALEPWRRPEGFKDQTCRRINMSAQRKFLLLTKNRSKTAVILETFLCATRSCRRPSSACGSSGASADARGEPRAT